MRSLAHRVYAVTGGNRSLGGALALLICAQYCFGIFLVVRVALGPRKFLDCSSVRARTHRLLVQPLPEIDLDVFNFCIFKPWRTGGLIHYSLTTFFGKSPNHNLISHGVLTRAMTS